MALLSIVSFAQSAILFDANALTVCCSCFLVPHIQTVQVRQADLQRLKARRNELNAAVRMLREELYHLQEPGSYVGEVVKPMGQNKILVKINPEGKYVVDLDKEIDIKDCQPNTRVALRNDSYTLHKILPTKVDPLVSLMKVEAVPDSTYDMIGGLEKQVLEIKEVIELPIKVRKNRQLVLFCWPFT